MAGTEDGNIADVNATVTNKAPQGFERLALRNSANAHGFLRRARAREEAAASILRDHETLLREVAQTNALELVETTLHEAIDEKVREHSRQWASKLREQWRSYFAREGFQELEKTAEPPQRKARTKVRPRSPLPPAFTEASSSASNDRSTEPNDVSVADRASSNAALLQACAEGDLTGVVKWANSVRQDGDLLAARLHGVCRSDGWGPLALAVEARSPGVVEMLVHYNAESAPRTYAAGLNRGRDEERASALHHICHLGDEALLEAALRAGAGHSVAAGLNLEARDPRGRTPLHVTASRIDAASTKLLLDHGASPVAKDKLGNSPLHLAVAAAPRVEVPASFVALLRPRIDARNREDETPLHVAAASGANEAVAELIVRGADVHAVDNSYWTPLCKAAAAGRRSTVRLLLDRGTPLRGLSAQAAVPSSISCTPCPLHLAAFHGASGVVDEFIEHEGKSCLQWLDWSWPCDTVLQSALRGGHFAMAAQLLDQGASCSQLNGREESALAVAIAHDNGPPPKALLARLICRSSMMRTNPSAAEVSLVALGDAAQIHDAALGLGTSIEHEATTRTERALDAIRLVLLQTDPPVTLTERFKARAKRLVHQVCKSTFSRSAAGGHERANTDSEACVLLWAPGKLPPQDRKSTEEKNRTKPNFDRFYHRDMERLFEERERLGADVQIIVQGELRLRAHRHILCARCPMFAGMFRGGMREASSLVVDLSHHSSGVVKDALRFVYQGSLRGSPLAAFTANRDTERFVDGREVLAHVEDAVSLLVLANEWLLPALETLAVEAVHLLLERHVLTSRGLARRKGTPRIRTAHVEELCRFAVDGLGSETLVDICNRIILLMRKLKRKDNRHVILPPKECVLPHGHDLQCSCPRGMLERHGLRFCRRPDSVVVDVAQMLAASEIDGSSVLALAPARLRKQIEAEGARLDARLYVEPARYGQVGDPAGRQILEDLDMIITDDVSTAPDIDEFEARFASLAHQSHVSLGVPTAIAANEGEGNVEIRLGPGDAALVTDAMRAHSSQLYMRSPVFARALEDAFATCALNAQATFDRPICLYAAAFSNVVDRRTWEVILSFISTGVIEDGCAPRSTAEALSMAQLADDLGLVGFSHVLQAILDEKDLMSSITNGVERSTALNMVLESKFHPTLWELEVQFRCELLEVSDTSSLSPQLEEHIGRNFPEKLPRSCACAVLALEGLFRPHLEPKEESEKSRPQL